MESTAYGIVMGKVTPKDSFVWDYVHPFLCDLTASLTMGQVLFRAQRLAKVPKKMDWEIDRFVEVRLALGGAVTKKKTPPQAKVFPSTSCSSCKINHSQLMKWVVNRWSYVQISSLVWKMKHGLRRSGMKSGGKSFIAVESKKSESFERFTFLDCNTLSHFAAASWIDQLPPPFARCFGLITDDCRVVRNCEVQRRRRRNCYCLCKNWKYDFFWPQNLSIMKLGLEKGKLQVQVAEQFPPSSWTILSPFSTPDSLVGHRRVF